MIREKFPQSFVSFTNPSMNPRKILHKFFQTLIIFASSRVTFLTEKKNFERLTQEYKN